MSKSETGESHPRLTPNTHHDRNFNARQYLDAEKDGEGESGESIPNATRVRACARAQLRRERLTTLTTLTAPR